MNCLIFSLEADALEAAKRIWFNDLKNTVEDRHNNFGKPRSVVCVSTDVETSIDDLDYDSIDQDCVPIFGLRGKYGEPEDGSDPVININKIDGYTNKWAIPQQRITDNKYFIPKPTKAPLLTGVVYDSEEVFDDSWIS